MGKSSEVNENTSLLDSTIVAPPPYTLEAEPSTSSTSVAAAGPSSSASRSPSPPKVSSTPSQLSPTAQPYVPVYPILPSSSPRTSHPTGPSPLLSLPAPVLARRISHRAADRRAKWRFLSALFWAFVIYLVIVNLISNPDLEGVRKQGRRMGRKVWRWLKGVERSGERWGREHHVMERVGAVIRPGQGQGRGGREGDQIMTIQAVESASVASPTGAANLVDID